MKHYARQIGVALFALALMALPALAVTSPTPEHAKKHALGWIITFGMTLLGTTITYLYPVSNTTTAPTAIQSSQVPTVVAQVVFADADTTAAITHNFGIATAAGFAGLQPNIAQGFPEVWWSPTGLSTVVATIAYTNTSGNVVTLSKASLLGTAGTLFVTIRKPQTIGL